MTLECFTEMIKTGFDRLLESGTVAEIKEMIRIKEIALNEALDGVEVFNSLQMYEHAENEMARVQKARRDLQKLHNALL